MRLSTVYALALILAACAPAAGQVDQRAPDGDADRPGQSSFGNIMRLMRSAQELGDWEEHHGYLMDSLGRVFERNGWNSEADDFAFELVDAVERVPPWDMPGRFDTFMNVIGDRYLLDEGQEQWLRQRLMQEGMGLIQRQAGRIMQYAPEVIATRAAGEAITPEQVARWAELAQPVVDDMHGTVQRAARDFEAQLDPQQREILQADMAAANRRLGLVRELLPKWRAGQWSEADWGLDGDPIQARGTPAVARGDARKATEAGDAPAAEASDDTPRAEERGSAMERGDGRSNAQRDQNARGAAADDDPWAAHVRAVIAKYRLNEDQQQHAWRIYRSAVERRDRLARKAPGAGHSARPPATSQPVNVDGGAGAAGTAPSAASQRLFEAFKVRLDRIPTRAQRVEAERK